MSQDNLAAHWTAKNESTPDIQRHKNLTETTLRYFKHVVGMICKYSTTTKTDKPS
jgi:hypothetical protein